MSEALKRTLLIMQVLVVAAKCMPVLAPGIGHSTALSFAGTLQKVRSGCGAPCYWHNSSLVRLLPCPCDCRCCLCRYRVTHHDADWNAIPDLATLRMKPYMTTPGAQNSPALACLKPA